MRRETAAGFKAAISENARSAGRIERGRPLRRADNSPARELVSTTEKSPMTIAWQRSDLRRFFGDTTPVAGTIEERALVKAIDDGDPAPSR